jgi:hypothetical protein
MVSALYFPNNDDGSMYYIKRGDGTQATRAANIAKNLNIGITYQRRMGRVILRGVRKDVARGLHIHCDWGPQYSSTHGECRAR